jgi:hypothetical protein
MGPGRGVSPFRRVQTFILDVLLSQISALGRYLIYQETNCAGPEGVQRLFRGGCAGLM